MPSQKQKSGEVTKRREAGEENWSYLQFTFSNSADNTAKGGRWPAGNLHCERLLLLFSGSSQDTNSNQFLNFDSIPVQLLVTAGGSGIDPQGSCELSSAGSVQEEIGQLPVRDVPMLLLRLSPEESWLQGWARPVLHWC